MLLLTGCGSGPSQSAGPRASTTPSRSHQAHDDGMAMDMSTGSRKPSSTASMICGHEIRDAVRRTFALRRAPHPTSTWDNRTRLFSCTYRLSAGDLAMSVQDAVDVHKGLAHFRAVRARTHAPERIAGMDNFGFPAFDTKAGEVAFVKDGKTLLVDARRLSSSRLPQEYDRADAAYAIASAVIACWTE